MLTNNPGNSIRRTDKGWFSHFGGDPKVNGAIIQAASARCEPARSGPRIAQLGEAHWKSYDLSGVIICGTPKLQISGLLHADLLSTGDDPTSILPLQVQIHDAGVVAIDVQPGDVVFDMKGDPNLGKIVQNHRP